MKKKYTAIEFLINKISNDFPKDEISINLLFEEALMLEKSQIIDAYLKNRKKGNFIYINNLWNEALEYYNDVYINK